MAHRILVVDDDPQIRMMVRIALEGAGYAVATAKDGDEVRCHLARNGADLVLIDAVLPSESGLSVAEWVAREKKLPLILLSGDPCAFQFLKGYPFVRLSKPVRMANLLRVIRQEIRAATCRPPQSPSLVDETWPAASWFA